MLGGADNPNGELPSYITGADTRGITGSRAPPAGRRLRLLWAKGQWLKITDGTV